jgi:hypothetical protein
MSITHSCRFTPGKSCPGTRSTGGWVGPRIGVDDVEMKKFFTLPGLERRSLRRPVRIQSLYRLGIKAEILCQSKVPK